MNFPLTIKISFLPVLVGIIAVWLSPLAGEKKAWARVLNQDGIIVEKEFSGKLYDTVLEFRGKGAVNAPMDKLLAIVTAREYDHQYIEGHLETRVIRFVSKNEQITYNAGQVPWPFQDRDFIARCRLVIDEKNKWTHYYINNIKNTNIQQRADRVRMPHLFIRFSMTPIKKGKSTWIEFYVSADSGGWIPSWITNSAVKYVPYKTLISLRRLVTYIKLKEEQLKRFEKVKLWY